MFVVDGVAAEIESLDPSQDGYSLHAWLRLADGRCALWCFDLRDPPGESQSARVRGEFVV